MMFPVYKSLTFWSNPSIPLFMKIEMYIRLTSMGAQATGSHYSDPELMSNLKLRDLKSGIYSIGTTMYYLLYGQILGGTDNKEKLIATISNIDDSGKKMMSRGTALDINKRYSSCDELIKTINVTMGGGLV